MARKNPNEKFIPQVGVTIYIPTTLHECAELRVARWEKFLFTINGQPTGFMFAQTREAFLKVLDYWNSLGKNTYAEDISA